ncbi:hypothetical protein [Thermodesulfatator autotrophicus]|nr:hypothetical protein [Thermodesulfatator autotrophicus]
MYQWPLFEEDLEELKGIELIEELELRKENFQYRTCFIWVVFQ